jgi:hypothetical protein
VVAVPPAIRKLRCDTKTPDRLTRHLDADIRTWIDTWNDNPPLRVDQTADQILSQHRKLLPPELMTQDTWADFGSRVAGLGATSPCRSRVAPRITPQHSGTFTANPPNDVSLYLECMSIPVCRMVSIA